MSWLNTASSPLLSHQSEENLKSTEEDILGRREFAKKLAGVLRNWETEESIVIALYGPWGSGKSSLINMILEHVQPETEDGNADKAPIIVRFNPWYFADQDQLITIFFGQLLSQIRTKAEDVYEGIKDNVKKYGALIGSPPARALLSLLPVVGQFSNDIAQTLTEALALIDDDEDIESLRDSVDEAFRELDRHVIIIIDDLDRLPQAQIRQMFQLVKIGANFPNTIYLIAADRKVLERALESEQDVSGRDYLEKIVQVGFNIPLPESTSITDYLTTDMDARLPRLDGDLWDRDRWSRLFHSGFKDLFTTIRMAKRFVNSLSFNYVMVEGEVNPVDFIGIEAIRVFAPDVYQEIANNKALFCGAGAISSIVDRMRASNLSNEDLKKQCDEIFAKTGDHRASITTICLELFPEIRRAYHYPSIAYGVPDDYRKTRRICHPEMFDAYFLLGVPKNAISRSELLNLIRTVEVDTAQEVRTLLQTYLHDDRITQLFDWMTDIIEDLSPTGAKALADTIVVISDRVQDTRSGEFRTRSDWLMINRLWKLMESLEKEERKVWLEDQLNREYGLALIVTLVSLQRENGEGPIKKGALFDEETTKAFQDKCAERIRVLAKSGDLLSTKNAGYILSRWPKWTDRPDEVKQFVAEQTATREATLNFLRIYAKPDDTGEWDYTFTRQEIDGLFDLAYLEQFCMFLKEIDEMPDLSRETRKVLNAWLSAARSVLQENAKTSGIQETPGHEPENPPSLESQ